MHNNLLYTHYNRKYYLNTFKKELTFVIPAQEVKTLTTLNQHLVKAGINYNDFCEKFDKLTINIPLGVLVPISVFYTPKEKNFELCLRPFQLKYILQQFIILRGFDTFDQESQKKYQITILDLYKALIIKSFIINEKNEKKYFRSILGTLRSYNLPVEILFSVGDFQQMLKKNLIHERQIPFLSNYWDVNNIMPKPPSISEVIHNKELETAEQLAEKEREKEQKEQEQQEALEEIDLIDLLKEEIEKNERN